MLRDAGISLTVAPEWPQPDLDLPHGGVLWAWRWAQAIFDLKTIIAPVDGIIMSGDRTVGGLRLSIIGLR